MKARIVAVLVCLCPLLLSQTTKPEHAGPSYTLKSGLFPGMKRTLNWCSSQTVISSASPLTKSFNATYTIPFAISAAKDGSAGVVGKIHRMVIVGSYGAEKHSGDSNAPSNDKELAPMLNFMKQISVVGALDTEGRLVTIKASDEAVRHIAEPIKPAAGAKRFLELAEQVSKEIGVQISSLSIYLPYDPVKVGDRWQRKRNVWSANFGGACCALESTDCVLKEVVRVREKEIAVISLDGQCTCPDGAQFKLTGELRYSLTDSETISSNIKVVKEKAEFPAKGYICTEFEESLTLSPPLPETQPAK